MTSSNSFDRFLAERERASTAFVEGDAAPLMAISVLDDPATIYPPNGAVVRGAGTVNSANEASAANFTPEADNHFDIVHSGADGDLAYWTGVQRSTVTLRDRSEPVAMALRITELFRRVDGEWKLFHRHADALGDD